MWASKPQQQQSLRSCWGSAESVLAESANSAVKLLSVFKVVCYFFLFLYAKYTTAAATLNRFGSSQFTDLSCSKVAAATFAFSFAAAADAASVSSVLLISRVDKVNGQIFIYAARSSSTLDWSASGARKKATLISAKQSWNENNFCCVHQPNWPLSFSTSINFMKKWGYAAASFCFNDRKFICSTSCTFLAIKLYKYIHNPSYSVFLLRFTKTLNKKASSTFLLSYSYYRRNLVKGDFKISLPLMHQSREPRGKNHILFL